MISFYNYSFYADDYANSYVACSMYKYIHLQVYINRKIKTPILEIKIRIHEGNE